MTVFDYVKYFAHQHVRPHAFPLYFFLDLLYVSRRNGRLVASFTEGEPYRPLSELDFSEYKTSDTLFLLGSGASINDLTDKQWQTIDAEDSLGFNFWIIHDYVPTYYAFEFPHDIHDFRKTFYGIFERRADDYQAVPIIMKDLWRTVDDIDMDRIPTSMRDNLYISRDMTIPWNPDEKRSLAQSLRYLDWLGYFDTHNRISLNFKQRASLSCYVLFATMLGYDEIVLCGVDLNDSRYFFMEEKSYYESRGVPIPDIEHSDDHHDTYTTHDGSLPIDEILFMINDVVLKPRNIDLYIGSKESALYPEFPYYFSSE